MIKIRDIRQSYKNINNERKFDFIFMIDVNFTNVLCQSS